MSRSTRVLIFDPNVISDREICRTCPACPAYFAITDDIGVKNEYPCTPRHIIYSLPSFFNSINCLGPFFALALFKLLRLASCMAERLISLVNGEAYDRHSHDSKVMTIS